MQIEWVPSAYYSQNSIKFGYFRLFSRAKTRRQEKMKIDPDEVVKSSNVERDSETRENQKLSI